MAWLAALAVVVAAGPGASSLFVAYWQAPPGARRAAPRPRSSPTPSSARRAACISAPVRWTDVGVDAVSDYFLAAGQNAELKRRLAAAQTWRDQLIALRYENERLRAMLGVRTDPPLPMVFAHTILDARGPFSNSRLADVGASRGVIEGNPVLSDHGLVGRVVGVARRREPDHAADRRAEPHAGADRPHQRPGDPERRRRGQPGPDLSADP